MFLDRHLQIQVIPEIKIEEAKNLQEDPEARAETGILNQGIYKGQTSLHYI